MAFFMVAAMMAGVGSAVSELREAQSLITPVMMLLTIPLILWLPITENDQDMPRLAARVGQMLSSHPDAHGFLIAGHGLYTWGRSIADAERHVEIMEFLLEVDRGYRQNPG